LNITVCHFPPGTSKWNKIEHRLFSFISQNWRGRPLYDLATIANLISHTTTREGLTVRCAVDDTKYIKGIKVSDQELEAVKVKKHDFHGEGNYSIGKQIDDRLFYDKPLRLFPPITYDSHRRRPRLLGMLIRSRYLAIVRRAT
jgi:hypothetical protein